MLWGELVERRGVGIVLRDPTPRQWDIALALQTLLPPHRAILKTASMVGAELRGERSCAAVAALLTACLCRLSLPPPAAARARRANNNGAGFLDLAQHQARVAALATPLERMCARHCVPCSAWRRGIEGPRGGAPVWPNRGLGGGGGEGAAWGSASGSSSAPGASPRRRPNSPSASAPSVLVGASARKGSKR
jgi:hypothetical protein